MKKNHNNVKIFLILFVLSCAYCYGSDPQENQDTSGLAFHPVPMRTGFINSIDPGHVRLVHQEAAHEAVLVLPTAQQIFDFNYNFTIPRFMIKALPRIIRSKLYLFAVPSDMLSMHDPIGLCQQKITRFLYNHGITNFNNVGVQRSMTLSRIINDVGFKPGSSNELQAALFQRLGMKIQDLPKGVFPYQEHQSMISACYEKASDLSSKLAEDATTLDLAEILLNVGQLRYWAASRAQDVSKQATLSLEALKCLHRARELSVEMGLDDKKVNEVFQTNYGFLEQLMYNHNVDRNQMDYIIKKALQ